MDSNYKNWFQIIKKQSESVSEICFFFFWHDLMWFEPNFFVIWTFFSNHQRFQIIQQKLRLVSNHIQRDQLVSNHIKCVKSFIWQKKIVIWNQKYDLKNKKMIWKHYLLRQITLQLCVSCQITVKSSKTWFDSFQKIH